MMWKDLLDPDDFSVQDDTTALILEHLLHHGYTQTARSLLQSDRTPDHPDLDKACTDTKQRQGKKLTPLKR